MFYIYIIFTEGYKIQVCVRNGKKRKTEAKFTTWPPGAKAKEVSSIINPITQYS